MGWLDSFKKPKLNLIPDFSRALFKTALEGANAIRKLAEDEPVESEQHGLTSAQWFAVVNEFQNFYLHLTDRVAFGNMDKDGRHGMMSQLEDLTIACSVETICEDWPPDMVEKIKEEAKQNLVVCIEYYSRYKKWFPEKEESPKDTLVWEFGKQIAHLAGKGLDISYVAAATSLAASAMETLDIRGFIKRVK